MIDMLDGWRILDFTDERGEVAGFVLADLGADVVKVEPSGGCPSRHRGHHAGDTIPFNAYNGNKRSLELTGDTTADRQTVLDLVATADVVFDHGPRGRLHQLGIRPDDLDAANGRIVHVAVTPFGLTGPRAEQPASHLTIGALGGSVWLQGEPDRPPVQISLPQVWRHAGAEAAVAALVAHRRMLATGQPQHADVSAQATITWTLLNAMEAHAIQGRDFVRTGSMLRLAVPIQLRIEAADGYVIGIPTGRTMQHLVPWVIEEGIVDPSWADVDWPTYDHRFIAGEPVAHQMEEVAEAIYELCRRYPKWDLFRRSITYGATLAPLNDLDDLLGFDHLEARDFWTEWNPGGPGGDRARAPGACLRINGDRRRVTRADLPLDRDGPTIRSDLATADTDPARPPVSSAGAPVDDGLPLAGVNVVDFSWIGVGPITAKALADHGATVVRVESENRLDGLRHQPPFLDGKPGLDRSHFFGTFNTSKLSINIDLKTVEGRDIAMRLAAWADVVVESFRPGVADRMGLGYEAISAENPSVVMASTSMLGGGGPTSRMAGYGYHASALAGFQSLVGWPDRPPAGPWVAYTDTIGPRFITTAILAALSRRQVTGEGCHIEASQLEMAMQFLAPEVVHHQLGGEPLRRRGNRDPLVAPQGVYPCAGDDQWLALSVVDDVHWERLVALLGEPAWASDEALATVDGRQAAHDEIDARLSDWTRTMEAPVLEASLCRAGIPAGVVQGSRQLLDDPQYAHRGFYRYLEHAEMGVVPYAGHQFRIEGYDHGPRRAAPCLGEHTYEVLTDLLGLDPDAVAALATSGALT